MSDYPPITRPCEPFEVRLPHDNAIMSPESASSLAKKYLILTIGFGRSCRVREMSRRGIVDWATLQIGDFDHTLSRWNGRCIPHKQMDVAHCLMAGDPQKVTCDDECSWFGEFLRWATKPPRYIQSRQCLRLELLTAAMLIYEASQ
jgi:hypothetical protein